MLNLERKVSLYVVLLMLFVGIIGLVLFGASVRHVLGASESRLGGFGEALLKVAEFPSHIREVLNPTDFGQKIKKGRFGNLDGFKKDGKFPAGVLADDGYLLLSTYNIDKEQSTVQLIQINTQATLYQWTPDIEQLNGLNIFSEEYSADYTAKLNFRLVHPLIMKDSGLVFNNGSGLYGVDSCGENNMFVDGTLHHSNELDHEGNIWVPGVVYPRSYTHINKFRDDAITKISPSGEVLFRKSIAEILVENGYRGLLSAADREADPIHINDIQPALTDSDYWRKGDLFLSLAHLGTVMLYRPSTNKILWLKTGPWMSQHDVNFVDDHTISVFGNDIMFGKSFDGHNSVYFYDFETNKVSEPYREIMKEMEVRTLSEGRGTPLPGGDLFIDESNYGRILRVSKDKVQWEYVNRIDKDTLAMSSWSRYLTQQEAKPILSQLKDNSCK